MYVDASNVAIGAVLSQKDDKNFDHPIYYASQQLVAVELNYTTTEQEAWYTQFRSFVIIYWIILLFFMWTMMP